MNSYWSSFVKNKYVANILKVTISVALLFYFLFNCNLKVIFIYVKNTSIWVFIGMIFFSFFAVFINSIKWNLLLKEQRLFNLFKLNLISQFYTLILPGQMAGEGMKTFILGKEEENMGGVAVSVIVDKITGFLGLFILAILGLLLNKGTHNPIILGAFFYALFIGIFLLFFFQFDFVFKSINLFLGRIEMKFPKKIKIILSLKNVFLAWHHYSKQPVTLIFSVLMGILYQLCGVLIFYYIGNEIDVNISVVDWFWIIGLLSIALFLPISIGGVGIREGTLVGILASFGIVQEKVLALSFAIFGIQIVSSLLGGAFIWIKPFNAS